MPQKKDLFPALLEKIKMFLGERHPPQEVRRVDLTTVDLNQKDTKEHKGILLCSSSGLGLLLTFDLLLDSLSKQPLPSCSFVSFVVNGFC